MNIACPRCRQINQPYSRFCASCGLPFAVQPHAAPRKSQTSSWLILFAIIGGLLVLCLVGATISSIVGKQDRTEQANATSNSAPGNTAPTPIPTPAPKTFAELKTEADQLLATKQSDYESVEPGSFDAVIKPLNEIPKDSKDYKAAQQLHKKLVDKAAVVLAERVVLGEKPMQSSWDGDVVPVKNYLRAALNDYDSSEFVEWSPVSKVYLGKEPYWGVRLRLRAKNAFGAYIMRDTYYYIRNNQVVIAKGLGGE
jgi:hypothetical protein